VTFWGFRGGIDFWHFFVTFLTFPFCWFYRFCVFAFCHFLCFYDFLIFDTFWVFDDFDENTIFYSFSSFFNFENSRVKIRPSFDLFCPPSSTPMASTWRGSFLNGEILSLFFDVLTHFWSFFVYFEWFFNFAIKNSLFLTHFCHYFWSNFSHFLFFLWNFDPFFEFLASFWPPLNPRQ